MNDTFYNIIKILAFDISQLLKKETFSLTFTNIKQEDINQIIKYDFNSDYKRLP